MLRRVATSLFLAVLGLVTPAAAQTPLSLTDALARARAHNPDAGSSAAAEREAEQRVTQARAGYWPRVDVAESWQRGNQPVFVFGSLLAQRQFTAADFALGALNHPDAIDNFRAAVTVEQSLFDGATGANVTVAGIGHEVATAARRMVDHDLAASVTDAYGRVLAAVGARQSADAVVETARADRENRRGRTHAIDRLGSSDLTEIRHQSVVPGRAATLRGCNGYRHSLVSRVTGERHSCDRPRRKDDAVDLLPNSRSKPVSVVSRRTG